MIKRSLAAVCAAVILALSLASCQGPKGPSIQNSLAPGEVDAQKDITFSFSQPKEDVVYQMEVEPVANALVKQPFRFAVIDGFDADWISDSDLTSTYQLYDLEKKASADIAVSTAPPDLEAYFGTTDKAEIEDGLKPLIFSTEDKYQAQYKAAAEDFGYQMVRDWRGEAYGWQAYLIEFVEQDVGNHAIRFFMSNDEMNENYYSLSFSANIPADNQKLIDQYRGILFSLDKVS